MSPDYLDNKRIEIETELRDIMELTYSMDELGIPISEKERKAILRRAYYLKGQLDAL